MASWAALNVAGNDTRDASARERATEEAQDADNAAMYEQALRYQQRQQVKQAKEIYLELLNGDVVVNSRLEYLCNKNLATMEFEGQAYEAALGYFAEALALDATDVVVWYQMAKTAIETGKLWLARHTLEEGMKVDAAYWPLVGTLAEVLFEIGDDDEYERVGAYLRDHDPQNASLRLMSNESTRRRATLAQENGDAVLMTSKSCSRKRPRPSVRDAKLLNRAQQRLRHLREITDRTAKRRRVLHDDLNQKLEMSLRPREYHLQQQSWQGLGKLLLQAFEDANSDVNTDTVRATVGIHATVGIEDKITSKQDEADDEAPGQTADAAAEGSESQGANAGSLSPKEEATRPPGTRQRQQDATPAPSNASEHSATATGASDNDTQDSGVPTSEPDELQPRRRKSRRHEQRLRQEHAAAVKKAREKDLAYRLRAFLPDSSDKDGEGSASESEVDKITDSVDWPSPLKVELVGTTFRVSNEKSETLAEMESFVCSSPSGQPSDAVGVSTTRATASNPTAEDARQLVPVRSVTRNQVATFVTKNGFDVTQSPRLKDLIREYLNQCGKWANLKLGDDGTEPHGVCFWLEKMLSGDLDVSKSAVPTQRSSVAFVNCSVMQGSRIEGGTLTLRAQLFLLELRFDMFLRQPIRRRRRVAKRGLDDLMTRAQSLLLEMCMLEGLEEEPDKCHPTEIEFVRLFWLLARMYERCGNPQVAQNYYGKCREKLLASAEEIAGDASIGGPRVTLPNQKADAEISLDILEEKISGLQFSDVCSEAKRLLDGGDHEQVVSILLGHFFPANQPPRIVDFLSEFDSEESYQSSHGVSSKRLFETVLNSLAESPKFSADDAILLLLTTLYHAIAVLDSLDQQEGQGASQNFPEEAFGNAFVAVEFLLGQLSTTHREKIAGTRHHLLMRALCVWCFKPSIILLFEAPTNVLAMLRTVLEAASAASSADDAKMESGGCAQQTLTVDIAGRLFYTIRRFTNTDFRDLFALAPYRTKKKQQRQERVRSVVADLLRTMNCAFRRDETLARSFAQPKRSALVALCCKMMKEEEDTVMQSEGKTAKQLFGNGAILFILLFESFQREDFDSVPARLVDLIHLLHERLGQHGICGLTYITQVDSQPAKHGRSCFLETCTLLLNKYVKRGGDKAHIADSERTTVKENGDQKDDDGSREDDGDEEEEEEEEEEAEAENWFKKEVCQCYRCLYDVQILSGLEDHRTGNTSDLLQKEDQVPRHSDAIRLARFAVPILLERQPKSNHQKKERLKLLYAVRDALVDSSLASLPAQPPSASSRLKEYLAPRDLLQWRDTPPLPATSSSGKNATADEPCLGNLWYLLGANFILGRVKRRGNLGELTEMERHVKVRAAFLTKDVLYYHPERIDSWIRLGKSMKELYHAATDACAAVLGQKLRIRALVEYSKQVCERAEQSPANPYTETAGLPTANVLSFEDVVLNGELFTKMKAWQNDNDAGQSGSSKPLVGSSGISTETAVEIDDFQPPQAKIPIEEYAAIYIAQVIEFSRRCFAMAARLGEEAIVKREQLLKRKNRTTGGAGSEDEDEFDEELDELRNTVIECYEECGLLLYNVLQEFSVMKEASLTLFPEKAYLCVVEKVLAYFRQGLVVCESDEEAHEVRFRLCYMVGKALKKRRWCEMIVQRVPSKESLATAEEMADCFAKAEASREEGEMEHALVHAFYALQALRVDLTTSEPATISGLRLACAHFFEEVEDEEDKEDQVDTDSNAEDQDGPVDKKGGGSGGGTTIGTATRSKKSVAVAATNAGGPYTSEDNGKITAMSRKDEILALLATAKGTSAVSQANLVVARGWLVLNIIEALESIPNEDRYFHPSRYVLARAVYWLSNFHHSLTLRDDKHNDKILELVDALEARRSLFNVTGPSDAAARAIKEMTPIFDKKRSQVVAIWFSEYIPTAKKFEELNQRQMKYDHYRLKYWRFYIRILQENEAYGRLKEVGSWVLACKEEHDVIDIMLGIVLEARGKVLRVRLRRLLDTVESGDPEEISAAMEVESQSPLPGSEGLVETILKHLAKAYTFYLEVVDAHHRLMRVRDDSSLLLENAELPMVAMLFTGAMAFPSEMPLLEKDVDLVDRDFDQNVTVIKNALRRDELPPRIYDAEGREAWEAFLGATRSFCEDRWPERMGKGKVTKSRLRLKSTTTGTTTAATGSTDATQTASEQVN